MGKLKQTLIDTPEEELDMPSPDYGCTDTDTGWEEVDDPDGDRTPADFWDNDEEILKKVE